MLAIITLGTIRPAQRVSRLNISDVINNRRVQRDNEEFVYEKREKLLLPFYIRFLSYIIIGGLFFFVIFLVTFLFVLAFNL